LVRVDHDTTGKSENPACPSAAYGTDERRADIFLDAAQIAVLAHGWDNVTIADVLEQAGIFQGRNFTNHLLHRQGNLLDGNRGSNFTAKALKTARRPCGRSKRGGAGQVSNEFF